jgi:glycosyltransferase 2 family protein
VDCSLDVINEALIVVHRMSPARRLLASKRLQILLSLSVSVGLLFWFAREIDFPTVWREMQQASWAYFLPATGLFLIQMWLRALRWQYLLGHPDRCRFSDYLDGIVLGNFGNYVLPLRAGEFIRPLIIKKSGGCGYTQAFVSVMVERVLDLAAVLVMFALLLASLPGIPTYIEHTSSVLGIISIVVLAGLLVSAFFPMLVKRVSEVVFVVLPERLLKLARKTIDDGLAGAMVFRSPRNLVGSLFGTGVIWFVSYLQMYLSFFVVGIHTEFWHAIALTVITGLAIAAPSAPGFIGVYQVAVLFTFGLCGLDESKGAAFAILTHIHQYLLIVSWGLLATVRRGMAIAELANEEEYEASPL